MTDSDCVGLLQWALPQRGLRWAGFRKFRRQVCKRVGRRIAELGLAGATEYRARLESDPGEWRTFEGFCFVTISRFFRDRRVWEALRDDVLPALAAAAIAAGEDEVRCWSVGCASAEEPYTLSILWRLAVGPGYPGLRLRVLATDLDERVLERARAAVYAPATLRELPRAWLEQAFEPQRGGLVLRADFRASVELRQQDVRGALPSERFRLICCRNVVCTYFDERLQRQTLDRLLTTLAPGGAFVIGAHERLPAGVPLDDWHPELGIYRRH